MNELVLFCLIVLIFLRAIGLGVSIDFLYSSKDRKFIGFMFSWGFWIIANIFPIFVDIVEIYSLKELFLVLNVMFALLGAIFYIWAFFKYFMITPLSIMITLLVISITVPFLLYVIFNFTLAILFCVLIIYILLLCTYFIPPLKKKKFSKYMGKSAKWYYATLSTFFIYFPISAMSFLSGYRYGLYNAEDPLLIMLYYVPPISSTVLLIILLVHLEYTISSREKFELKDKYSHDLGNIMQVINSSSELIEMNASLNKYDQVNLDLIKEKCKDASKLIKDIRKL